MAFFYCTLLHFSCAAKTVITFGDNIVRIDSGLAAQFTDGGLHV